MINSTVLNTRVLSRDEPVVDLSHAWVTVPNPMNKQALLQACDYCGVVKSQNTLFKRCSAETKGAIISSALQELHH